jgi:hypothetical protein
VSWTISFLYPFGLFPLDSVSDNADWLCFAQELGHRDVRGRCDRLRCQLPGLCQEILHRACGSCQECLIRDRETFWLVAANCKYRDLRENNYAVDLFR